MSVRVVVVICGMFCLLSWYVFFFYFMVFLFFFFQAEDGIRDLVRSRGLGDVYKRQAPARAIHPDASATCAAPWALSLVIPRLTVSCSNVADEAWVISCLLYTSDAADERSSVDLGGRRILKKKTQYMTHRAA